MKLHKSIALLLSLALLLSMVPAVAFPAQAERSGYYTYTVSNGEATITDCNTSISGEVTIPGTLGGYPVTSIGASAFSGCTSLTSITIPDSVTSIGYEAFYKCTGLTSVTIPDSVTSIGSDAFYNCKSITGVYITDLEAWCKIRFASDDANPLYYAKKLYLNNELVTDLVIPDGVTSFGSWAFRNCTGLTSVTIPDSVTSIGSYAFENCTGLTSVTIGDGVTGIGFYAFENCIGLTSVTIGNSVTRIGDRAFYNCTGLTSITIPDSVTKIGDYAFNGCTNLNYNTYENGKYLGNSNNPYVVIMDTASTDISACTIHEDTKIIGNYAFRGCTGLTSITIPDSVTSIGYCAFYDCTSLISITIPDSVTSIGSYAFSGYTGQKYVFYAGTATQKAAITIESNNTSLTEATWHYEVQEVVIGEETYFYCPECDKIFGETGEEMKGMVKFLDADGTVISETTYPYGKPITVPADPTKAADKTYTYTFAGWGENFSETCVGDATYTATYTPVYIDYTVTFLDWNGSTISSKTYHYGDTVAVPADPVRANEGYLTYNFTGWDKEIATTCAGNATYTATYRENIFLQDALQEAAQTGGTVKLTQDTQVVNLVLWNGATLDLNGYTLTVDYFSAFGMVVDGTIGGNALVVVNKGIHVAGDNSFMPIYDTAAGGYRFYKYELQNLGFKAAGSGTVKAGFRLTLANPAGYGVLSNTTDIALDTVSLISWTGSMGVTHYTFSDNTLRNYAVLAAADVANKGTVTKAITLTLTGVDSLGANPTVNFQPTVATAPGMTAKAPEAKWTAQ